MDKHVSMTLARALALLRRLWFVPVVGALLGVALGLFVGSTDSTTTSQTKVALTGDPSLDFAAAVQGSANSGVSPLNPSLPTIAAALTAPGTKAQLESEIGDTALVVTSNPSDSTLTLTVSGDSTASVQRAIDAYVDFIRASRVAQAKLISSDTRNTVEAARKALQTYLDGGAATGQLPDGTPIVVLDRAEAADQLVNLSLLDGAADRAADFDGGVTAASSVSSSSSGGAAAALLGVVFFALGIVGVLVLGPLDSRIRTRGDLEQIVGSTRVVAIADDDLTAAPLVIPLLRFVGRTVHLLGLDGEPRALGESVQKSASAAGTDLQVETATVGSADIARIVTSGEPLVLVVRSGLDRRKQVAAAHRLVCDGSRSGLTVALVGVRQRDQEAN